MVWIRIESLAKGGPIEGGVSLERECGACGEVARFEERRASSSYRRYLLDGVDVEAHRVMACGECGALFATDELGRPSEEAASGWRAVLSQVGEAVGKAGGALGPAAQKAGEAIGPAWDRASENARELFEEAKDGIGPMAKRAGESVSDALRRLRASIEDGGAEDDDDDEPEEEDDRPESERERDPEKAAVLRRFEELERKMKNRKKD